MILSENNPEFLEVVQTKLAIAVHKLIFEEGRFTAFCDGRVNLIPTEAIFAAGDATVPAIWVYRLEDVQTDEDPSGNARTGQFVYASTTVRVILIDRKGDFENTRDQLHRRILGAIQALVTSQVALVDPDDDTVCISDSVIRTSVIEELRFSDVDRYLALVCDFILGTVMDTRTQLPPV